MDQVYTFWFGVNANTYSESYKMNTKLWFRATGDVDTIITTRFKELVETTAQNPVPSNARDALCMIILLDQFPRHIYRGTANAFKYDHLSLQIAEKIISQNWINDLSHIEALFVYFALLHQESVEHAKKAVVGFHQLSMYTSTLHSKMIQSFKKSAERHLEIIEKFGRYPHRNKALGRTSTAVELEFMEKYGSSLFMKSQQPKEKIVRPNKEPVNRKRYRILCLHGWRQNGQIFKTRLKKMVKQLEDIVEFHFVTSPVEYKPEGDALEATLSAYETVPDYNKQRVWWISSEGNRIYQHSDVTLASLKQIWETKGPFDGIFGFAQGGTMAAIMSCKGFTPSGINPDSGHPARAGFNPQFLILVSSYFPRADEFQFMDVANSLKTPSMHIYGKNDILVVPERSKKLHEVFVDGKLIEHAGGHFTPKFWPLNEMRQFISQFTPYDNSVRIDEENWYELIHSVNSENIADISKMVAEQLRKDFAVGYNIQQTFCQDKFHFDKPATPTTEMCPSKCVDAIIGRGHTINKKYHFAQAVAAELFPRVDSSKQIIYFYTAVRILKRMRYRLSPEYNDKIVNWFTEARASEKRIKMLENEPPSHHVINPKPEPVVVCSLDDLKPLIEFMESNQPVMEQMAFPKGTITTDGRLDLCKQVVGPQGIGPVLLAMRKSSHVKRLLLGNNIVSDIGAEEIAREMRVSQLECWYIAGNDFTANGIVPIAEALKDNCFCTSLWLKRNPLGPLGMKPIADMLMVNRCLQVLDLVNCGMLEAGLETLLGGLMGENRNRTLRVLWLDTNAITYKSAELISKYIGESCELTDLSLSCNRLSDVGMEIIAKGLSINKSLTRFSVASNRIGPIGAKFLGEAIKDHPAINFINLGYIKSTDAVHELGNFIGDEGAAHMAELLRHNRNIRHLDLLHNSISQVGVNHIISALHTNTTLVKIQLQQFARVHNETGKEYIKEKLAENYSLLDDDMKAKVDRMLVPWYIADIYSVYRTK